MPAASKKVKQQLRAVEDQELPDEAEESSSEGSSPEESSPEESSPEEPKAPEIEMVEIPFRGHSFRVPKDMDDWHVEACLAMGENNYAAAAKILLGTGQWAALLSLGENRRDMREFLTTFGDVVNRDCVG